MKTGKTQIRLILLCLIIFTGCGRQTPRTEKSETVTTVVETASDSAAEPKSGSNPLTSEDKNKVNAALERLTETAEVKSYLSKGMTILYTEKSQKINGEECALFEIGTDGEENFVREFLYGVSKERIYLYDVLNDTWNPIDKKDS